MIITRTPLRISLIGGGTDVPAFYERHGGAVVSLTINRYVFVSVNKRFEGGYRVSYSRTEEVQGVSEIRHDLVREALKTTKIEPGLEITSVADIPGNGTGLGSSSSFTVGLLNALLDDNDPAVLAERAFLVEAKKCFHPVGKQDQYAAAFGGMNYMLFGKHGVSVYRLNITDKWKRGFEKHALLLWTGVSRNANSILESQSDEFLRGRAVQAGKNLSAMAREFYEELTTGMTIKRAAERIHEGWVEKMKITTGITTPEIDDAYEKAKENGAWGGKLLGAGGGGFLLILAPIYTHKAILEATGLRRIDFKIEMEGSKVIYDGND